MDNYGENNDDNSDMIKVLLGGAVVVFVIWKIAPLFSGLGQLAGQLGNVVGDVGTIVSDVEKGVKSVASEAWGDAKTAKHYAAKILPWNW